MGRHSANTSEPTISRTTRTAALAAVGLTLVVVTALIIVAPWSSSGPTAGTNADSAARQAASISSPKSPAPAVPAVIPGVRFTDRIFTLDELKTQYAAKGMRHVEGDPGEPTVFVAASYNVLGSSHAKNGPARARRGGALLQAKNVSVVGVQELQGNQRESFLAGAGMTAYPPASAGRLPGENAIAWDPTTWELIEGRMQQIPYFHGKLRAMPYVLLRHLETGRQIWWMNVHNPADVFGCKCAGWRAKAIAQEVAMINSLQADGTPVFFTGDLNDRREAACRISTGTGMVSADGVTAAGGKGGSCRPVSNLWIDWVWGSGEQVSFAGYSRDFVTRKAPRMSDHPSITATATIAPATGDQACDKYQRHSKTYWFCPDPTMA